MYDFSKRELITLVNALDQAIEVAERKGENTGLYGEAFRAHAESFRNLAKKIDNMIGIMDDVVFFTQIQIYDTNVKMDDAVTTTLGCRLPRGAEIFEVAPQIADSVYERDVLVHRSLKVVFSETYPNRVEAEQRVAKLRETANFYDID